MAQSVGMAQESKVVVGLDFGTTFSGFAYALRAEPDKVYNFYDWPMQVEGGGLPYCKTQTSLLYAHASRDASVKDPGYQLLQWGWPDYVHYKSSKASEVADSGSASVSQSLDMLSLSGGGKKPSDYASGGELYLVTLFKLHLATNGFSAATYTKSDPALPPGLTAMRAITDYLCQFSKYILKEVKHKFGSHISLDDIEWCLTVPAIWDEQAKKEMRICSEMAGLVQGPLNKGNGSPHLLKLFIDAEAASVYCQQKLKDHEFKKGDKFLVVDCGGGTVDLVLHEKLGSSPSLSVREVQESSGRLCGDSRVDEEFFRFLRYKIRCFERFEREYPATVLALRQDWEKIKYNYAGEMAGNVHVLDLPPKLATMWEGEEADGTVLRSKFFSNVYKKLVLNDADMRSIFDPFIGRILRLIEERMVSDLQAIMVVGGFSASPYLMSRIRDTFRGRVATIVSPPHPGSAVCCGAVTMGIRSDTVVSRISKKTYGIRVMTNFIPGLHPVSSMVMGDRTLCGRDGFFRFVRKGDEVRSKDCIKYAGSPLLKSQTEMDIEIYSSDRVNDVKYVTEPGVQMEGKFTIDFPSHVALGFEPEVEVSMFFGRTDIQVSAIGKNFDRKKKGMLPVKFERHSIY